MKRMLWATVCTVGLLPASLAWSQQDAPQPSERRQTTEQGQAGQTQNNQRPRNEQAEGRRTLRGETAQSEAAGNVVPSLAMLLALGNRAEIELSQLAVEKTQNPQVREFAQKMIQDHTQYLTKLKKFNPQIPDPAQLRSAQATQREGGQPGAAQTPQRVTQAGGATPRDGEVEQTGFDRAAGGQHQHAMVAIFKDACETKLQMTKESLAKLEGQDFDMGYLSNQVHAHVDMLAHLQAIKGKGDSNFNQLIEQGITTTTEHLTHAKDLAKKLESHEYEASGNQPNQQRNQPNQQRNAQDR